MNNGLSRFRFPAIGIIALTACGGEAPMSSEAGGGSEAAAASAGGGGRGPSAYGDGGDDGAGGAATEPCDVTAIAGPQADFACTMVVGFSQTMNWYGTHEALQFEAASAIVGDRWQLLWHPGAGVESWADPAYSGWDTTAPLTQLVSPCATSFDEVDRVVLTISSNLHDDGSPVGDWAAGIQHGVDQVRAQVPNAERIVLQPVVGTDEPNCDVRAAKNHPLVVAAIAIVAADAQNPDVVAGAIPTIPTCNDYRDPKGHLGGDVATAVGRELAHCYGDH